MCVQFNELRSEAEKRHSTVEKLSADLSDVTKCNKQLETEIDKLKAEFEQSQSRVSVFVRHNYIKPMQLT